MMNCSASSTVRLSGWTSSGVVITVNPPVGLGEPGTKMCSSSAGGPSPPRPAGDKPDGVEALPRPLHQHDPLERAARPVLLRLQHPVAELFRGTVDLARHGEAQHPTL